MNRVLTYKNVMVDLGKIDSNTLDTIHSVSKQKEQSSINIDIHDIFLSGHNDCVVNCDIKVTYRMVDYLLDDVSFKDMYYLFSQKQTVTKEEILHKLLERDIIKNLILS